MIGSSKLFCSNRSWPSLLSFQSSVLAAHRPQLSHGHPSENFSWKSKKKKTQSTSEGKAEGFSKKGYLDKVDHMGIFSPFLPFLGYIHRYKCSHFHNYFDIPIIDQQVFLYTLQKLWREAGGPFLTDTGENVQKWTRVFSTRRWVIHVARARRKKRRKYRALACIG